MAVADTDPATFKADKDRQIATVLEKVQIAQKNLSCVQAAQDHAALKICEEDFKQKFIVPETKEKQPPALIKKSKKHKNQGKSVASVNSD